MSTDIYSLLGSALAVREKQAVMAKAPTPNLVADTSTPIPEPVILLNRFPIILNPSDYANPLSTANPTGDLRSLWRFRQLVDPLPQYASYYTASSLSTETAYVEIVGGAVAKDASPFVTSILADAQRAIQDQTFANMDGTPGRWRPVYAVPDDWYNAFKSNKLNHLNLDLSGLTLSAAALAGPPAAAEPIKPFITRVRDTPLVRRIVGNAPVAPAVAPVAATPKVNPLLWKVIAANKPTQTISFDAGSKVNSAQVNYLMVSLTRPWFNMMVFKTGGWYLDGQETGFCSSGKNDGNGIMPLIPSSLIIGTSAAITATWSNKDAQLIASATAAKQQLFLGPLPINTVGAPGPPPLYVLGWVMAQVPFSPKIAS